MNFTRDNIENILNVWRKYIRNWTYEITYKLFQWLNYHLCLSPFSIRNLAFLNVTIRPDDYVKESGSNEKTKYYIGNIPNYLQIWASNNKELFYHKWSLHIFEPFKSSIFSYRMTLFLFKQNAWTQKYLQLYNTSEIL